MCIGGAALTYGVSLTAYIIWEGLGLKSYLAYYMSHYEILFSFITSLILFMSFRNIDMGNCKSSIFGAKYICSLFAACNDMLVYDFWEWNF